MAPKSLTIGIDLLGGETPSQNLLDGVLELICEIDHPTSLLFFVTQDLSELYQQKLKGFSCPDHIHINFHPVSEFISLEDHPIEAVKHKKGSSMHQGVHALKNKKIDAFISIGNTGALLTLSKLSLNLIPGITRPALIALMPTRKSPVAVVDLGANVACKPHLLVEFAEMGVAFQRTRSIENPTVGILNIGNEEVKGTQEIRQAHAHIAQKAKLAPHKIPDFLGNVESHDVFEGKVDVLVTEGFSGNIFLKTAEATSSFLLHEIKSSLKKEKGIVESLESQFGHEGYPGALFIGCDGVVMKCHSYSDSRAVVNAIQESIHLIEHNLIEKMKGSADSI